MFIGHLLIFIPPFFPSRYNIDALSCACDFFFYCAATWGGHDLCLWYMSLLMNILDSFGRDWFREGKVTKLKLKFRRIISPFQTQLCFFDWDLLQVMLCSHYSPKLPEESKDDKYIRMCRFRLALLAKY